MTTGAIVAVAVTGSVLFLGGLVWLIGRFNRALDAGDRRGQRSLAEELSRRGWLYSEQDDSVVAHYNYMSQQYTPALSQYLAAPPRATAAKDVITGVHRGRSFVAAVLDTHYQGEYVSQRCVWLRLPAPRPTLTVRRMAAMASRVNDAIGTGDIKTGNSEFDAIFDVRSESPEFATAVLTPGLVQSLLANQHRLRGFMLLGDQLDVTDTIGDHRDPVELTAALDLRCDIADAIPVQVWS